jgi:hypothetical protein
MVHQMPSPISLSFIMDKTIKPVVPRVKVEINIRTYLRLLLLSDIVEECIQTIEVGTE